MNEADLDSELGDQLEGENAPVARHLDRPRLNLPEREFFIDNLLVRKVTIRWTGLAPWEFEFSELSTFYESNATIWHWVQVETFKYRQHIPVPLDGGVLTL